MERELSQANGCPLRKRWRKTAPPAYHSGRSPLHVFMVALGTDCTAGGEDRRRDGHHISSSTIGVLVGGDEYHHAIAVLVVWDRRIHMLDSHIAPGKELTHEPMRVAQAGELPSPTVGVPVSSCRVGLALSGGGSGGRRSCRALRRWLRHGIRGTGHRGTTKQHQTAKSSAAHLGWGWS